MTIMIDTPDQINMWVLLSRRHQLKLHAKGYKVKGIFKWIETNLPAEYLEGAKRTALDYLMALNDYIGDLNGPEDDDVNYRLYLKFTGGLHDLYVDHGVFATMSDVEAFYVSNGRGREYMIGRTWDEVTV